MPAAIAHMRVIGTGTAIIPAMLNSPSGVARRYGPRRNEGQECLLRAAQDLRPGRGACHDSGAVT